MEFILLPGRLLWSSKGNPEYPGLGIPRVIGLRVTGKHLILSAATEWMYRRTLALFYCMLVGTINGGRRAKEVGPIKRTGKYNKTFLRLSFVAQLLESACSFKCKIYVHFSFIPSLALNPHLTPTPYH